jgi:peptide methionine sulfoxide reductase MsrB
MKEEMNKFSKDELKKTLTLLQFKVTQEKATERPFTGEYDNFYEKGKYECIVCKTILFKLVIF